MKKNGPSHTVGHESSKQQGRYSLERNQCVCADAKRVSANDKKKPMSLDTSDVVRDVENLSGSEEVGRAPTHWAGAYGHLTMPAVAAAPISSEHGCRTTVPRSFLSVGVNAGFDNCFRVGITRPQCVRRGKVQTQEHRLVRAGARLRTCIQSARNASSSPSSESDRAPFPVHHPRTLQRRIT
jgi:hypothetical protein